MLRKLYHRVSLVLEKRPWGIQVLYHSTRHYKLYEFIESLLVAFFFAALIKSCLLGTFMIPSESMVPALQVGDRLFVNKLAYLFHPPEVGDIIVFKTPSNIYDPRKPIYIKRVVGGPGDTVAIENGKLYVNGRLAAHPVIVENYYTNRVFDVDTQRPKYYTSETIPEKMVYGFGDNSANSMDSRYWGGIPLKNLKGKAVFRFWPPRRFGWLE